MMLNKSDKSGHLCLVTNFRGKVLNVSPVNMMIYKSQNDTLAAVWKRGQ